MKLEYSRQIFEESSNVKFHQNLSNERRVVPCDGQKEITKLIVNFRNFSNCSPRLFPIDKNMYKQSQKRNVSYIVLL